MAQVKIGPEFFSKAINDYADWRWALIREFMQNSIDCGSRNISIDITETDKCTILVVDNDGEPMSENILVNKLLSLGSSGKDFAGTVGGFGKAKELLYFCWAGYRIETGNLVVEGSGAEYTLSKVKKAHRGTKSTVILPGRKGGELERAAHSYIQLASVNCRFRVNGELVESRLRKGYFRRDLPFGKVYTNRQERNLLVVRMGGTPMFTQYCKFDGCVVVELNGTSAEVMTSNRDGLRYDQRVLLEGFVGDLTTNKRKALKQSVTEYLRYDGPKLKAHGFEKQAKKVAARIVHPEEGGPALGLTTVSNGSVYNSGDVVVEKEVVADRAYEIASEFTIKNETGKPVKQRFRPDSDKFSKYAFKMITLWTRVLVKIHKIFQWEDDFGVGFVFTDNDVLALFEQSNEHGKVYYLNPVVIQGSTWKQRYRWTNKEDMNQMIATAVHELCHGMGYHDHDENFSSKLTQAMAEILNLTTGKYPQRLFH